MASILKIGDNWRAQVRRKGHKTVSQTFPTKQLAQAWARGIELDLDRMRAGMPPIKGLQTKLSEVFEKALAAKNLGRTKRNVLEHLNEGLGSCILETLTAQQIIQYIETRGYSPSTAMQELSILGTTLNLAEVAWGYKVPQVFQTARKTLKMAGKISKSQERDRRPTADELDRICLWFDAHSTMPMRDLVWFAIYTTMRAEEVVKLRWDEYNAEHKTIIIRDRKDPRKKTGNHQEVPLLDAAVEIIERQPRASDYIFPYNHKTFSSIFPRACQLSEPRIKDLRWHDLRHEGTSRLFEKGYQIHEVAMFTGHKDWRQLKRYTQLRAKDLRRL